MSNTRLKTSIIKQFNSKVKEFALSIDDKKRLFELFEEFIAWKHNFGAWSESEIDDFLSTRRDKIGQEVIQHLKNYIRHSSFDEIQVFLLEFLDKLAGKKVKEKTIRNYRSDIKQFIKSAKSTTVAGLITREKLDKFVDSQLEKRLKSSSINRKLSSITRFAQFIEQEMIVKDDLSWLTGYGYKPLEVKTSKSSSPNLERTPGDKAREVRSKQNMRGEVKQDNQNLSYLDPAMAGPDVLSISGERSDAISDTDIDSIPNVNLSTGDAFKKSRISHETISSEEKIAQAQKAQMRNLKKTNLLQTAFIAGAVFFLFSFQTATDFAAKQLTRSNPDSIASQVAKYAAKPWTWFADKQDDQDENYLAQNARQMGTILGAKEDITKSKLVFNIPTNFKAAVEALSLSIEEALNVAGDSTLGGDLTVAGETTLTGDTTMQANLQVDGDANVDGNLTVAGTSVLTGDTTLNVTNINGALTLAADVSADGVNIDLGDGELTAGNVVYTLTAGDGLTVSGTQDINIELDDEANASNINAFSTIDANGTTVAAGGNDDELILAAGGDLTISASGNTITLGVASGLSGWTDAGTTVALTTATDWVGIGTATPTVQLHVGAGTPGDVAGADDVYVTGDLEVDGIIYGAVSGTISPGFDEGSVVFADGSGNLEEDNDNFFWDDTNNYLGLGTSSPQARLVVNGGTVIGANYIGSTAPANGLVVEGNVGIGTTNPGVALDVGGGTYYIADGADDVGIAGDLELEAGGYLVMGLNSGGITTYNSNAPLRFYHDENDGSTENAYEFYSEVARGTTTGAKLVIEAENGYVGIGDTNPGAHLVIGDDSTRGIADGAGDIYIQNDLEVDGNIYGTIAGTLINTAADLGSSTLDHGDTLTINGDTSGTDTLLVGDTYTISFDTTEVGTNTWGSGSPFTWTFDSTGGVDPSITFGDNQISFNAAEIVAVSGSVDVEGYMAIGNGSPLSANSGTTIDYDTTYTNVGQQLLVLGTVTGAANQNIYGARIDPESITAPTGTTPLVASLYIDEPNLTATGTITDAASLYIAAAPTEASNNYALWVDSGATQLDGALTIGTTGTDGQLTIYNELGATDYSITLNPSDSQSEDTTYTLPPTNGDSGEVLATNGSGLLTWEPASGLSTNLWERTGTVTHVRTLTDDLAVGGSTSTSPLFFDEDVSALLLNPYGTSTGNTGEIRFSELVANGTNYTGFQSPDTLGGDIVYVLPTADATTANQVLSSDSSGTLAWIDISAGAGGLWVDGGDYLYTTDSESLGNTSADGSNKLQGAYFEDDAPLVLGTTNDFNLTYDATTDNRLELSATNQEFSIDLGNQDLVIAGSAEGTNTLTLTAGDLNITDGDLRVSSGETFLATDSSIPSSGALKASHIGGVPGTAYGIYSTVSGTHASNSANIGGYFSAVNGNNNYGIVSDSADGDLVGSATSGGDLLLISTTDATKGEIQFHSDSYYINSSGQAVLATDETLNGIDINSGIVTDVVQLGIGTTDPNAILDVRGDSIFNEDGGDYDFRIEGDDEDNLFFVDASADRIGIGTNSPDSALHIKGSSSGDITKANIHLQQESGQTPVIKIQHNATPGINTGGELQFWRSRGTSSSPSSVSSSDGLGEIDFYGRNTSAWTQRAQIAALQDGSTDTGRITFSTNDSSALTERMRINSSGNVGIGNSNPQSLLHVGSAGTPSDIDGTDDVYIYDDLEVDGTIYGNVSGTITPGFTEGSVVFTDSSGNLAQDNSNFFWDDGNNRLGIGTTSPSYNLDVQGTGTRTIQAYSTSTGKAQLLLNTGGNNWGLTVDGGNYGGDLRFQRNGSDLVSFESTGEVGIGTTSPASALSNTSSLITDGTNSTSTSGVNWSIDGLGYAAAFENSNSSGLGLLVNAGNGGGSDAIALFQSDNKNVVISQEGEIGIGTTNPSTYLHIDQTNMSVLLERSGTNRTGSIQFADGTNDWFLGQPDTDGYGGDGSDFYFGTSLDTPLVLFDSSGNVGIGDTSPAAHLVVGDDTNADYADGTGDVYIQNDLEVDGTLYANNLTQLGGTDTTIKGKIDLTGIDNINDVYVYDTSKDIDGGAWRHDDRAKASSWYNETIDATGAACTIASDDRCGSREFPELAILVATNDYIYVFDAKDNTMWMRIDDGVGGHLGVNGNAISVFALNGIVYVGKNSSTGHIQKFDFKKDSSYAYVESGGFGVRSLAISGRNTSQSLTYTDASLAPISSQISDIHAAVIDGKTFLAAGTVDGVSIINETDQVVYDYSDVTSDYYKAIWLTDRGELYTANSTQSQVEKWNDVHLDTADEANGTPDMVWDESSTPAVWTATPTLPIAAGQLFVTEGTSTVDNSSDTLYFAHGGGLSVISDKKGDETNGSVKYYTADYITEEMVGDIQGAWTFTDGDLSSGNTITGVSINGTTLKADTAATIDAVSGVRGEGYSFAGTEQLWTDVDGDGVIEADGSDNDGNFNPGSSDFSFGIWVKSTDASGENNLVANYTGTQGYLIRLNAGKVQARANDGAGNDVLLNSSSTIYSDGNWHHLVAVADRDGNLYAYVDGVLVDSADMTAVGSLNPATPFQINDRTGDTDRGIIGTLDEPFYTAEALTAGQIRQMYEVGKNALEQHSASEDRDDDGVTDNDTLQSLANGEDDVYTVAVDDGNQVVVVGSGNGNNGAISIIGLNSDSRVDTYTEDNGKAEDDGSTLYDISSSTAISVSGYYDSQYHLGSKNAGNNGFTMAIAGTDDSANSSVWMESGDLSLSNTLAQLTSPTLVKDNVIVNNIFKVYNNYNNYSDENTGQIEQTEAFIVDNNGDLTLRSHADGATGSTMTLDFNSPTPADADTLGIFDFAGRNDADEKITYGRILGISNDVTDATEDGELTFSTMQAGTLTEAMRIDESGYVGIGTTSPGYLLTVQSSDNNPIASFTTSNQGTTDSTGFIFGSSQQTKAGIFFDINDTRTRGDIVFANNNVSDGSNVTIDDAVMVIDQTGQVGIGTTDPDTSLHVSDATTNAIIRLDNRDTTISPEDYIGQIQFETLDSSFPGVSSKIAAISESTTGDASLGFFAGRATTLAEKMRLNSLGNLGIGTTGPQNKLHIKNNGANDTSILIEHDTGSTTNWPKISMINNLSQELDLQLHGGSGSPTVFGQAANQTAALTTNRTLFVGSTGAMPIIFGTNDTEAVRVDSSGNVGIGTTDPNELLELSATNNTDLRLTSTQTTITDYIGKLVFYSNEAASNGTGEKVWIGGYANRNATYLDFATSDNNSATGEIRMRIDEDGLVGVGTTSPSTILHLNQSSTPTLTLDLIDSGIEKNNSLGIINFNNNDSNLSTQFTFARIEGLADSTVSNDAATGALAFSTTGTTIGGSPIERMRIDSSGNVGIGTTDPQGTLDLYADGPSTNYIDSDATSADWSGTFSSIPDNTVYRGNAWSDTSGGYAISGFTSTSPGSATGLALIGYQGVNSPTNPALVLSGFKHDGVDSRTTLADSETVLRIENGLSSGGGSTLVSILGSGNVGIGTTAPLAKLSVSGNATVGSSYIGSTAPVNGLVVEGYIGIGTTNPTTPLHVVAASGNIATFDNGAGSGCTLSDGGVITCSSDERLKKDVENVDSAASLELINQLEAVKYHDLNEEDANEKHFGFIAQDVELVAPELVTENIDGFKGISYDRVAPLLVGAVQQLSNDNAVILNSFQNLMDSGSGAGMTLVEELTNLNTQTNNLNQILKQVQDDTGELETNLAAIEEELTTNRLAIGTTASSELAMVVEQANIDTSIALLSNSDTSSTADVLELQVGAETAGVGNAFVSFKNGAGDVIGEITGNETGGVTYSTSGADFAEYFPKVDPDEILEPGDIVCLHELGGVRKCGNPSPLGEELESESRQGEDLRGEVNESPLLSGSAEDGDQMFSPKGESIIGVISEHAGFVGNSEHADNPNYALVGILGQLPVKLSRDVTGNNGDTPWRASTDIKPGDALTVGSDGRAIKATSAGYIVGKAIASPETDEVLTYINPSYYIGDLTANGTLAANLSPEMERTSGDAQANQISEVNESESDLFTRLESSLRVSLGQDNDENKIASLESELSELKTQIAQITEKITEETELPDTRMLVGDVVVEVGSVGTVLGSTTENPSPLGEELESESRQGEDLRGEVGEVTNQLSLSSLTNLELIADLIKIDEDGNMAITGDLDVEGTVTTNKLQISEPSPSPEMERTSSPALQDVRGEVNSASLGSATLAAGETQVIIKTSALSENSKVFTSLTSKSGGQSLIVEKNSENSFVVSIETKHNADISFDWWIVDSVKKQNQIVRTNDYSNNNLFNINQETIGESLELASPSAGISY